MLHFRKTLIATTALMTLTISAYAADSNPPPPPHHNQGSDILNGQIDFQSQAANVNTTIKNVGGDVSGSAVSAGNVLQAVTMQDTNLTNNQYVGQGVSISSKLNADVSHVGGDVSLTSQAICNSADVSTDPNKTKVYSNQECNAVDPSAAMNANLKNIGGDVSLATTAVGNTFSEDTNAPNAPVQNYQINNSGTFATSNTNIQKVGG